MRTLVVTENITVDGVIDMAAGWFDPLAEDVDQSDLTAATAAPSAAADALLLGRNTFESFRGFWPEQTDDPTGVSDYLNSVSKYVVSSTMDDPGWENSTVLSGPLAGEVRALKETPGRDIVATGSIRLVHALIAEGLVDEYRLFVFPVVVGEGARLFEDAGVQLELLETRPFASGALLVRYAAAGD
jgi:dihydrofolate reductase